tara:strand:- start:4893 stop:8621 length:3729 start_codon:yes stop_codon:yes gene_type:complete
MAEVKNAFIKSKMNKDLEARLVPSGEYRNAVNAQVSRSEGANVGALENVLGNISVADFASESGCGCTLHSIGAHVSEINNKIYIFLTDNTGAAYNKDANNFIYEYNVLNDSPVLLVQGAYLNFSTQNPIYGINVLENLLFWTDNRNQPRKINLTLAIGGTYYTNEDHVSIAKLNPFQPLAVYQTGQNSSTAKVNEPAGSSDTTVTVDQVSGFILPGADVLLNGVATSLTVSSYDSSTLVVTLSGSLTVVNNDDLKFEYNLDQTLMFDVTSATLPDGSANPYYEANFAGDSEFLTDKFVRFAYRYKFVDGEYSIISPFTQICFIPKQDGYFTYTSDEDNDENDAYQSTVVGFMENKIDKIQLEIPMPFATDGTITTPENINSVYKIEEIDILYKESDGIAVQVVDTITQDDFVTRTTGGEYLTYIYESTKPFKTLPSDELIRVYDKVPVKALSQEIVSNRVVYGNFQDKHSSPTALDYNVTATDKSTYNVNTGEDRISNTTSIVEYPNSSLKANRNYQVGFVLCDRYGRQSSVVLSNTDEVVVLSGVTYKGSTIYLPYYEAQTATWPGSSLKVILNSQIDPVAPNSSTYWPGVYNGDTTSADYNPLGWYSYKIVVQQQEQEYYNVYLPGIMASYPDDQTLELGKTSHTVLINDNINKVPRDLSEVGPDQKQFRSSVQLFGRVQNTTDNSPFGESNEQYDPGNAPDTVSTISTLRELFDYDPTDPPRPNYFPQLYLYESNPLVARISTVNQIGQISTTNYQTASGTVNPAVSDSNSLVLVNLQGTPQTNDIVSGPGIPSDVTVSSWTPGTSTVVLSNNVSVALDSVLVFTTPDLPGLQYLAVMETEPVDSRLDIYYETTSAGLITDLNNVIATEGGAAQGISNWDPTIYKESLTDGDYVLQANPVSGSESILVQALDAAGMVIDTAVSSVALEIIDISTTESTPTNVTSLFEIEGDQTTGFNIKTKSPWKDNEISYWGSDNGLNDLNVQLRTTITPIATGVPAITNYNKQLNLNNVVPNASPNTIDVFADGTTVLYGTYTATNGSNLSNAYRGKDITWNIKSVTSTGGSPASAFTLDVTSTDTLSTCQVKRNTSYSGFVVTNYVLVIECQDAEGLTEDVTLNITMTVDPDYVKEWGCFQEEDSGYDEYPVVEIKISTSTISAQNGYYFWSGTWAQLQATASGGVIQIDYTNAYTGSGSCGSSGWVFSTNASNAEDYIEECEQCENPGLSSPSTVNFSAYEFQIV